MRGDRPQSHGGTEKLKLCVSVTPWLDNFSFQNLSEEFHAPHFGIDDIFDLQKTVTFAFIQVEIHLFAEFDEFVAGLNRIFGRATRIVLAANQLHRNPDSVKEKIR